MGQHLSSIHELLGLILSIKTKQKHESNWTVSTSAPWTGQRRCSTGPIGNIYSYTTCISLQAKSNVILTLLSCMFCKLPYALETSLSQRLSLFSSSHRIPSLILPGFTNPIPNSSQMNLTCPNMRETLNLTVWCVWG